MVKNKESPNLTPAGKAFQMVGPATRKLRRQAFRYDAIQPTAFSIKRTRRIGRDFRKAHRNSEILQQNTYKLIAVTLSHPTLISIL
jgi:hypothetical protein